MAPSPAAWRGSRADSGSRRPPHRARHRACASPHRGGVGRRQDIYPLRMAAGLFRTMLKSKIHRATVTQADLHYVGSITVDADLMDSADLLPGEQVAVVDVTNGARLETYVIPGTRGSGVIGINGAAAHLVNPGDLVILISYAQMDDATARSYQPRVVHVDAHNRVIELGADPAAAVPGMVGELTRGDLAGPR